MGGVFVTGTVGSAVVEHLLRAGDSVIAGIRDPQDAASVPGAAETRAFSFADPPDVIGETLEGADRLFLMRPPAIADVQGKLFPVIDVALRRGIRQIASVIAPCRSHFRLGRILQNILDFVQELRDRGVVPGAAPRRCSCDTSTAIGSMMLTIMAALGQVDQCVKHHQSTFHQQAP